MNESHCCFIIMSASSTTTSNIVFLFYNAASGGDERSGIIFTVAPAIQLSNMNLLLLFLFRYHNGCMIHCAGGWWFY